MYENTKLLIIDPDPREVCKIIAEITAVDCFVTGIATTPKEARSQLNARQHDLVLLDSSFVAGDSFFDLDSVLGSECTCPVILFAGATALKPLSRSMAHIPSACVTRPISTPVFTTILQQVLKMRNRQRERDHVHAVAQPSPCFIKIGDRYKKIDWKDIVYLRSESRYTSIFNAADKKEYLIRSTLIKTLEEVIPGYMNSEFLQVNRAEAVQLSHITEFSCDEVKTLYNTMHLSEGFGKQLRSKVMFLA
jgi:DNA-binding LytR/AlgR family response regulator